MELFRPFAASASAAVLVLACGMPRSADAIDRRCAAGFDMLEKYSCGPGTSPEQVKFALEEYRGQCKDPASVARIEKIEATCLVAQGAAVRQAKDGKRSIRARYVREVSALLLDPAYPAAADRYRENQDPAALDELTALARKHGIEPSYGKDLDLW